MRVGEVARQLGVSTSAVRNYTNQGLIEHSTNPAGQRTYTQEQVDAFLGKTTTPIYAYYIRSSSGNKQLLNQQLEELTHAYGEPTKIYRDSASGLNENRPGLQRLLRDAEKGEYNTLCITYPDRLTRFGITYLTKLLAKDGITLQILHENTKYSLEDELMSDFMSLIASFSGKFYRLRSRANQEKLLNRAKEAVEHGQG